MAGAAVLAAVLRRQSDLGPARLAEGYSGWPAFGDNNLPVYIEPGGPDPLTVHDEVLGWGWWAYPPAELRFSRPVEATGLRVVVGAGWPDSLLGPYNPEVLKANGLIFRVFAGNRQVVAVGPLALGEVRTIDTAVPASMDVRITAEPVNPDLPRPWAAVADAHFWRTPWLGVIQWLSPGRLARLVANPGARNDPVEPVPVSGLELTNGPSRLVVACEGTVRGTFGLYRSGRPVLTARLPFAGEVPECRAEAGQIEVNFPRAGATATFRPAGARGFVYSVSTGAPAAELWPVVGTVHLGGILEVLTDNSRPVQQRIRADGWERRFEAGAGRPVIFRNGDGEGLLIASPDPTDFPLEVITRRPEPDRFELRVGRQRRPVMAGPQEDLDTITLWLEPIPAPEGLWPSRTAAGFLAAAGPPPPPPDWYELEFEPWYVYWLDIDQDRLLEQLGLVRRYFGDLGRWFVTLDAGWYLSGEKPGNWEVDLEKFPGGLRGLGLELRRLGIPAVLYFTAPLLDDRAEPGNWLNLAGFIEQFPELVVPLRQLGGYTTYLYDYANPTLLSVLETTISAHLNSVGAVGMFLDGLMDGDREVVLAWAGGLLGPVPRPVVPRQAILESVDRVLGPNRDRMIHGWALPGAGDVLLRRPTSNLFGDSYPAWNHPYPWGGLWEHLDYALMQRLVLGEQPNMGSVRILPDESGVDDAQFELAVRWLEAAILTDAQVSLSFDLNLVKDWGPRRLSQLRGHLLQVRPGWGRVEGGPWPLGDRVQWVWNFRGELSFLGVFGSRQGEGRDVYDIPLPGGGYAYYEPFTGRGGVAGASLTVPVDANRFRMFTLRFGVGPVWADAPWEWAADNAVILTGPTPDQPVRSAEIVLYLPGPAQTYDIQVGSLLTRAPAGVVRCRVPGPAAGTRVSWTPAEGPPIPEAVLTRACRPVPPLEPAPAPAPAPPDVPRGR